MELHDSKLEEHLVIFDNFEGVKFCEPGKDILDVVCNVGAHQSNDFDIYVGTFKNSPEAQG